MIKKYVKYDDNKKVIEVAPYSKGSMINYNSVSNDKMLLSDGYSFEEIEFASDGNYYLKGFAPVKSLEEVKVSKMSEINTLSSQEIIAGFWWDTPNNGRLHFSYDEFDQLNIVSALNGANMAIAGIPNVPDNVNWNGYSDIEHTNLVEVNLTALEVITFWSIAESHKGVIMGKAKTLKEQVTSATTVEEVEAIQWK